MRNSGFVLSAVLLFAVPAVAQTPLGALAPATPRREVIAPLTVTPTLVACADLPTTEGAPTPTYWIVTPHSPDDHTASVRDHIVVLNGGTPTGLLVGQRYFVRRWQPPINGEPTGPAARASIRTAGWLTVIAADERSSLARVDYSCDTLEAGDYLEPYVEPTIPDTLPADGPTNFSDLGRVLLGVDRRQSFGAGDFLSIDRGATRGAAIGTRVAFYRDRERGAPLVELGTGIVVEVSPETSKVVVQRAIDEIRAGDYYGVRGVTP